MANKDELGVSIMRAAIEGQVNDPEQLQAILAVAAGAPLLREIPSPTERPAGIGIFHSVLDADGNLLEAGRNYSHDGKKIKVLREEFGSGNILDTFYWVYYIDETLEERRLTIQGRLENGFFGPQVYRSKLRPWQG